MDLQSLCSGGCFVSVHKAPGSEVSADFATGLSIRNVPRTKIVFSINRLKYQLFSSFLASESLGLLRYCHPAQVSTRSTGPMSSTVS